MADQPGDENDRVDVHTHVVPPLPDHAGRLRDDRWPSFVVDGDTGQLLRDGRVVRTVGPPAWDMDARVAAMNEAGAARHVLSPLPPLVCDWGSEQEATSWTRSLNEAIAGFAADRPDRFTGFGTVSLHHPQVLVAELEHARDVGLCGVEIGTSAAGRELDHPDFLPFFEAAEALGMRLFIHPLILGAHSGWTDRICTVETTFGLGMGTDTAIAASRLAFGGVTARHPNLSVCLAHGGGTFFWALTRIARIWDLSERAAENSAAQLTSQFVVDTVVFEPRNVEYLIDALGADRVLFGTDFPVHAPGDLSGPALARLTPAVRSRVRRESALAWLGLQEMESTKGLDQQDSPMIEADR